MRNSAYLFLSSLFIFLLMPTVRGQVEGRNPLLEEVAKDPVAHYLAHYDRKDSDDLYEIRVPNRQGGHNVLLSVTSDSFKEGNAWVVFAPVKGGYRAQQQCADFRLETVSVGNFAELGGTGLLSYAIDAQDSGALYGYVFDGTDTRCVIIGKIHPNGVDRARYDRLFAKWRRPKIKVTPARMLPKVISLPAGEPADQ